MTDNVVKFPKDDEEPFVFVCVCGCTTFFVQSDQSIECANCQRNSIHVENELIGEWVKRLPNVPEETDKTDAGTLTHTGGNTPEFARARVLKTAKEWTEENALYMIALFHADGTGRYWINVTDEEGKQWCLRKLKELTESLEQLKP